MNLNLRKFDMKMIPQDAVCVFIGRRRTGKSTLLRDLLFRHKDMPIGSVISATEESNHFYKKLVPPTLIHGNVSSTILDNYVKRQKMLMARVKGDEERGIRSTIDPRSFLILDDCMYDDSWTHDLNIRYLFMNGRWLKVLFLITMQYPLGIPPALRTNVDFTFILREPFASNRRKIYENYGSVFPSFDFFCQIMDQCTQDYECLVINNTTQSNKLEDSVFWYKAEIHGDFKIGSPEMWRQAEMMSRQTENSYDPSMMNRRPNAPSVSVKKMYQ